MFNLINRKKQNIQYNKFLQKKKVEELINQKREERKRKIEENKIINSYYRLHRPFEIKTYYDSVIPLQLYTCWHSEELPPLMKENVERLKQENPEFEVHVYDEKKCREFIKTYFEEEVVYAYDTLAPASYKSDLWRFCVLYIHGGIYLDIKYQCVNGFKLIALTEKEHFVRDEVISNVYTALIASKPKNEILRKCINQIVENVEKKYYGNNSLSPTGPGLFGQYFSQEEKNQLELYHYFTIVENKVNEFYVVYKNRIILTFFRGYREEQSKYQNNSHYSVLWDERKIYIDSLYSDEL